MCPLLHLSKPRAILRSRTKLEQLYRNQHRTVTLIIIFPFLHLSEFHKQRFHLSSSTLNRGFRIKTKERINIAPNNDRERGWFSLKMELYKKYDNWSAKALEDFTKCPTQNKSDGNERAETERKKIFWNKHEPDRDARWKILLFNPTSRFKGLRWCTKWRANKWGWRLGTRKLKGCEFKKNK